MSVIPGVSYTSRMLVDGTLAITVHVEPRHAQDAFTLFCKPGTALALAALKSGAAQNEPEGEKSQSNQRETALPKTRMGPLCEWAVKACGDELFQSWAGVSDERSARAYVLATCRIQSRKELDGSEEAAALLHAHIRGPFVQWQRSKR